MNDPEIAADGERRAAEGARDAVLGRGPDARLRGADEGRSRHPRRRCSRAITSRWRSCGGFTCGSSCRSRPDPWARRARRRAVTHCATGRDGVRRSPPPPASSARRQRLAHRRVRPRAEGSRRSRAVEARRGGEATVVTRGASKADYGAKRRKRRQPGHAAVQPVPPPTQGRVPRRSPQGEEVLLRDRRSPRRSASTSTAIASSSPSRRSTARCARSSIRCAAGARGRWRRSSRAASCRSSSAEAPPTPAEGAAGHPPPSAGRRIASRSCVNRRSPTQACRRCSMCLRRRSRMWKRDRI